MDKIYDESGLIVGEAAPIGEQRPETESTDIDLQLPSILDDDVLTESGLFPTHDPFAYRVEEAKNGIDRGYFIVAYLAAKESCPALLQ